MTIEIGFTRKELVTVSIKLVDTSITEQELLEGLQSGLYEIMESSREIVSTTGDVVGNVVEWEPEDLTHGDFELFDE